MAATRWPILVSLAIGAANLCFGLDPAKRIDQYVHRSWDSKTGLPLNTVLALTQTEDGYLWIGTTEGLLRFNGTDFTYFNKDNTSAIHHNPVHALNGDLAGNLWVESWYGDTNGGMLQHRDGKFKFHGPAQGVPKGISTGWINLREDDFWYGTSGDGLVHHHNGRFEVWTKKNGLSSDMILALMADRAGQIWISTDAGLDKMTSGGVVHFHKSDGLSADSVFDTAESRNGDLWVATGDGVDRAPRGNLRPGGVEHVLPHVHARALMPDRDGGMWILPFEQAGAYYYQGGRLRRYGTREGLPEIAIRGFLQDKDGAIWAGTGGGGLCRLASPGASRFECYTAEDGLESDDVYSLLEDSEGGIWVGTQNGGLEQFTDGVATTWWTSTKRDGNLLSVAESRDGAIWLATTSGLKRLSNGQVKDFQGPGGPAGNMAVAVVEDRAGDVWVGTMWQGAMRFTSRGVKQYPLPAAISENGLVATTALFQDRAGDIWLGGTDGMVRWSGGRMQLFTTADGAPAGTVRTISEDREGNLWLMGGRSLGRFHDGKFSTSGFLIDAMTNVHVLSVYEDADRVYWVATQDGGLRRYKDGQVTIYTTRQGMTFDSVGEMLEDDRGNLWMTSGHGISVAAKQELNDFAAGKVSVVHTTAYGVTDGMVSTNCASSTQNSATKMRDGRLLFACGKGLVVIDPRRLGGNTSVPAVRIERAILNGSTDLWKDEGPLARKGDLEFHFAALSFHTPAKIRFQYKLEGYDQDWIPAENRHAAYYTNIPPAAYTFRVRAAYIDGAWSPNPARLDFHLTPRFYQTYWFRGLCVVLLGAAVGGVYLARMRQSRRRERELTFLVDERTRELRQEIAQRRDAEQVAQKAKQAAEAAAQAKSAFLANMSHEIRTPLNGVVGMLELIGYADPTQEQKDLLGIASESANSLMVVINDILDFSKIEAGKLEFDPIDFDLGDTVAEAVRTMAVRAHEKRLELAYAIDPAVPQMLVADTVRLKQVLINLAGNALKFTDRGEVVIRVERENTLGSGRLPGEEIGLRFSVSDTGIGIPKDKQQLIFEAFSQADASTTRKFGGTGLGLAICTRIVRLMGGRIWVESEPGIGSTFFFTVTVKVAGKAAPVEIQAQKDGLRGKSVLVVDDNPTNRTILEKMLAAWGLDAVATDGGARALDLLREADRQGTPYSLILMDFQMPEMDGLQFAAAARAEGLAARSAMVMLTSDGFQVTGRRCRELGIGAYLLKPVKHSELLATMSLAVAPGVSVARAPSAATPEDTATVKLKLLLAEDNPVNRKVAVRLLERLGHQVETAANGLEALELLRRDSFDMVFMDLQMPEMDGLAATEAIRNAERGLNTHIPIIAMTAHAMLGDQERCLQAGMDDYVSKPINSAALQNVIARTRAAFAPQSA